MPRPKQFDEVEVLDKAVELFWRKGFNGTSMRDLVNELGINRASLYDTFGGKHQLFMAALARYQTTSEAVLLATVGQDRPVLFIIEQLLQIATSPDNEEEMKKGCFMLNCTTELAIENPEIAKLASKNVAEKEELFFQLIQKGQDNGEISQKHDARALARFLFSTFNGLKVVAQSQANPAVLADVRKVALDTLKA